MTERAQFGHKEFGMSSGALVRRPPGPALGRPEDRLRGPLLCGHALAVTAPDEPAYQPFDANTDDSGQQPNHGVGPGLRLLV